MLIIRLLSILLCLSSFSSFASSPLVSLLDRDTASMPFVPGSFTSVVYSASDSSDRFCNGAVLALFRGKFYCQWQSSPSDEDSPDTRVYCSVSSDSCRTWSTPMLLADTLAHGFFTSGGWLSRPDSLICYLNFWASALTPKGGYCYYISSADGVRWTSPRRVLMHDGTPLNCVIEQDPHTSPSGRIITAGHFIPGLHVSPIYTDDPSGVRGWHRSLFTCTEGPSYASVEIEPSLFFRPDSSAVMLFRDQNSSFRKLASVSLDDGVSWSAATSSDFPDSRTKQSCGNLPDGTAFSVGCPVSSKFRCPLVLSLSSDGEHFTRSYIIRDFSSLPPLRYQGRAKRLGYHYPKTIVLPDRLIISYSVNKESIHVTTIPLSNN